MSLRPRLLASTSVLVSSVCAAAWAQIPTPQQQPAQTEAPPAEATPAPQQSPSGEAPATTSPALPNPSMGGAALPTIKVTAQHKKPPPAPHPHPPPKATTPVTALASPSPFETGAPNVAGGTAVVPQLASQMTISGQDLNARPVAHTAEILEAAPGLAVVEHSGSGKANQYYLRGYDLDHGTDMATFWDDVPINLPTNAHGQGYTDLNFLIPETVSGLDVRKGP